MWFQPATLLLYFMLRVEKGLILKMKEMIKIKKISKWENTYEEAFKGFLERGLYLDEPKETFNYKNKSNCHCINHPDNKMSYSWEYVRIGRFSCKECRKENGREFLTIEDKINNINSWGLKYIDGNLSNVSNTINVQCKFEHIFSRSYNNLKRGNIDCPFCNGTVPMRYWNKDTCQKWINDNNIGYKILDTKNENGILKIYVHCGNKEHEPYWCSWAHFKSGTRCNCCYYENNERTFWTLENAKEILKQYGYTMLNEEDYKNSHDKIDCIDELGFKYPVSVHYITQNRTKFSLWRNNKYAVDNIKRFCELYRPDYEFISDEYIGNKKIHRWRYLGDCLEQNEDREFDLMFGHFVNGNGGHPSLSRSKLESKCKLILDKYNIKYKMQKTFDGCKYKNKLRFDFYFILNNQEYCIETDGNQHLFPIDKYGGLEGFEEQQKKDQIKNNYCKNNGIILIRIYEKDFRKMEEILVKRLNLSEEMAA